MTTSLITADWPAPTNVVAACSTRSGGTSVGDYAGNNLAAHVGDAADAVQSNRLQLAEATAIAPQHWQWLSQTHGANCVAIHRVVPCPVDADAALTGQPSTVCTVLTADCLPVLLCDSKGTRVAAIHAGWRGLAAGIIGDTVVRMRESLGLEHAGQKQAEVLAWLGPAIGPAHFEVGGDVVDAFTQSAASGQWRGEPPASAFTASGRGKYLADIYQLARQALLNVGVDAVYGGGLCTFSDREQFYSYRRDGNCGRMASFIYLKENTMHG